MTDVATNTEFENTKLENIDLEIEPKKNDCSTQTQTFDKDEYDRKCSQYSTAGFLLGVAAIIVYGISTI